LYAVNSGANSIAVIRVSGEKNANPVIGLIPTAYEPHDITFSQDGAWMYIVSGKSLTGPNPNHLAGATGEGRRVSDLAVFILFIVERDSVLLGQGGVFVVVVLALMRSAITTEAQVERSRPGLLELARFFEAAMTTLFHKKAPRFLAVRESATGHRPSL
jgi:hypothetical protein